MINTNIKDVKEIEIIYEAIEKLMDDPDLLSDRVRAEVAINYLVR